MKKIKIDVQYDEDTYYIQYVFENYNGIIVKGSVRTSTDELTEVCQAIKKDVIEKTAKIII